MRAVTCRLSPRSLGTKFLILAGLAVWMIIGAFFDMVEREALNYVDSPWSDWMDTKRYRPLPDRNVSYAKIRDDVDFPEWTPKRLVQLLEESSSSCRKMTDLGGSFSCKDCQTCFVDGNKYICFDPDVRWVCVP
ncbi:uncharacterized protein LOC125025433 [Penaeus chinensis]|uniref:uncharacterized protein LOC125025433 n=1 Tax=Penaeus chinensis TaxID=139456 RepID=UPI001FB833AC|nr:uncharacterized protein LOC125025433 [Penaeus chinensis]